MLDLFKAYGDEEKIAFWEARVNAKGGKAPKAEPEEEPKKTKKKK